MLKELDPVINNLAHPENIIRENCKEALETFAKSFKLKEMPLAEVKNYFIYSLIRKKEKKRNSGQKCLQAKQLLKAKHLLLRIWSQKYLLMNQSN